MSTNELTLRQSIEREQQEEERLNKRIELFKKKFLKQRAYRKYKLVPNIEEADIIILLKRNKLSEFAIMVNNNKNEEILSEEGKKVYEIFYLKNKNPRDGKLNTIGDFYSGIETKQIPRKSFFV